MVEQENSLSDDSKLYSLDDQCFISSVMVNIILTINLFDSSDINKG